MSDSKGYSTIQIPKGKGGKFVRGVRYRQLAPDMVTHIEGQTYRGLPKEATNFEAKAAIMRMSLEHMVLATTAVVASDKFQNATWVTHSPESLRGDANWSAVFDARETDLLEKVYEREHIVTTNELDEIMSGKVEYGA